MTEIARPASHQPADTPRPVLETTVGGVLREGSGGPLSRRRRVPGAGPLRGLVYVLLGQPEHLELLRRRPELIPGAVEELATRRRSRAGRARSGPR